MMTPAGCRPVLATAVLLGGCVSVGGVQLADTLGRGHVQVGLEPGAQLVAPRANSGPSNDPVAVPHLDAAVRYGVTEAVDVGLRVGQSVGELQGKFLLTRPGHPLLAVSLAPSVGGLVVSGGTGAAVATAGLLSVAVPVLIGVRFRKGSELVLGPRLQGIAAFGASGAGGPPLFFLGAGASVGFAWRLSGRLALMPELAALFPVAASGRTSGAFPAVPGLGTFVVQLKVGVLIGQMRELEESVERLPPHSPLDDLR